MSKFSSPLGRPGSAGSKSPMLGKKLLDNRSCMLRIGERLMRAGSEGNLVQRPIPAHNQSPTSSGGLRQGVNGLTQPPVLEDKPIEHRGNNSSRGNSPSRVSSSPAVDSSSEHLLQKKQLINSSLLCNPDFSSSYDSATHSPSTLPRGYATTAGASSRDSQLDSLMMQQSVVERKMEVFLDHLSQRYPHHAAIIMGNHDCMRKQAGSPWLSESSAWADVLGMEEQQDPLALEAMCDGEVQPPQVPFTRDLKARASLPVGRSSGQTRERKLGVLYLQYGEETKLVRMPADISSQDTLRALFVTTFPDQLTMTMLQSPNMAIYIKDPSRNIYYDLEDIRNITSHSCLRVYHKDPKHVLNRHARPANTEGRISKELLYSSHSPVHTVLSSSRSTLHSLQGSMSPPMVRSMPSSPSRMAYGRASTRGGLGPVDPGRATLPRERLSGVRRSSALCTNSSAILERRDVKPDKNAANSKSMVPVVCGEGGPYYPDSYCSPLQDGGGHLSITSSQCHAPPSLTADVVNAGVTGFPEGLQQYRTFIKPSMGYEESMEHQTHCLHRQKSGKLGPKTPPPSPHRVNEVRMTDRQIIGGVGLLSPERMSPICQSLQWDSNEASLEIVNRSSSSSPSSVFVDSSLGQHEKLFQGHVTASNSQSERMKAMEEQIASLAGRVHHALSMGPVSETAGHKLFNRPGVSCDPPDSAGVTDSFSPTTQTFEAPPSDSRLQQSLVLAKRNVYELRRQLSQLRHLQLSNQESVSSMLRMAGQELVVLMCDRLAQSEEAAYRQKTQIDEARLHYLAAEERILIQLSELEDYVDCWQRNSTSSPGQLSITLKDVEEGAISLRRVGEAVAILKGEFPELQAKMHSVLRLEVEAVHFLKEEPHKMDSMLKRVKALTEALSSLRRSVSESTLPTRPAQLEPLKVLETDQEPLRTQTSSSPKLQPRSSDGPSLPMPSVSADQPKAGSASPIMARKMKRVARVIQPSHHHPNPPLTCTHVRESPSVAKVSPCSREGSPLLQRRPGPLRSDGLCSSAGGSGQPAPTPTQVSHTDPTNIKHRQTHTETTERQTPEGSLRVETSSVNHSITSQANQPASFDCSEPPSPNTNTDFNHVLQESMSDLNESDTREGQSVSASGQIASTASKSEQDTPLDLSQKASVDQQTLLSNTQEDTPSELNDEVDSNQLDSTNTAAAAPLQFPAAAVEPHPSVRPSASSSTERSSRPQVAKPPRSSVDKEMKQSPDRASKSPPAPPPRRFQAVSSGLTMGGSGEVMFTTRKEVVGAQDEGEKGKESPVVPQPKPPRQPPEVKPKPKMCAPGPSTASAHSHNDEEEEDDNKVMKERQTSNSSFSSSAQRSHSKSHHSSSSCSPEKTPCGQKQAIQKQRSQADSRSGRAAEDSNRSVVALRASKIPALCHSSGKHLSASLSTPHCSDTTKSLQNLSSSSTSSAFSNSSPGKRCLLPPPSTICKCPSHLPSPSSNQCSTQQVFSCPLSHSSLVKNFSSVSPTNSLLRSSPSFSSSAHDFLMPSLNLSHLLPSSSHILSPSHTNVSPTHHGPCSSSSKRQHHLVLVSSSSSPLSPSSSLLPTMVSRGARGVRTSGSGSSSLGHGKKRTGGQAGRVLHTATAPPKDSS
ncbi:sickle tail protein homolog [Chelmon rostratus]|uniref:sickle tail protein homolog n=1 Tax=Chelmon rostratus TaxID=109905 RepID=UPI001BE68FAB|nr:sickle tail protein homolog [Chelmon rostratus]